MFVTTIKNLDEMYDGLFIGIFDPKENHADLGARVIAFEAIESGPIDGIFTHLTGRLENYVLSSIISLKAEQCGAHFLGEIPSLDAMIEKLSSSYKISACNPYQLVVSGKEQTHFINSDYGSIAVRSPCNSGIMDIEKFRSGLAENANILATCVETIYSHFCKRAVVPDMLYVIGEMHDIAEDGVANSERSQKNQDNERDESGSDVTRPNKTATITELEKRIEIQNPKVTFEQIGGCKDAKIEIMRIFDDIVHPELAKFFGRDPEQNKGYLILGESGCGKTMLVKALATKLKENLGDKIKFYSVIYDDITSIYRGGEAQKTGQLFDIVRKNEAKGLKTLLFLDEIHSFGQRHHEHNEALDTLISYLDGIDKYNGLTVIGATYMPCESLDPALTRNGRLSRQINIPRPDSEARAEIFRIYLINRAKLALAEGNNGLFSNIKVNILADATSEYNGSHIAEIVGLAVDKKENEVYQKVKSRTFSAVYDAFTPITNRDILNIIENYQKVSKKQVGFRIPTASSEIQPIAESSTSGL